MQAVHKKKFTNKYLTLIINKKALQIILKGL